RHLATLDDQWRCPMSQESAKCKKEDEKIYSILLTPKETWKTLKISRSTCYHLIRTGEIKSVRFGRAIRIPRVALIEWLESKIE
ncbi:MAG: helix-turn-helix domain-containing protein, partial [Firmicutes bacterium]|nr:helix-turn-helix domain-containing protein [Bacillota bacterium]